jgi:RES domain-containing protein
VVNLERLARVVEEVAQESYDHEGWISDGAQILEPLTTEEVVMALLEDAMEPEALDLAVALTASLINEELDWFEPFGMDREDGIEIEWDFFEQRVKHETRLLLRPRDGARAASAAEKNYAFIESLLFLSEERAGLIRELPRGTKLYRARSERDAIEFERTARERPARELGPAPSERASAGRMNAQGVPMFYVALDAETACAEVASHSPYDEAVVGRFIVQQKLRVLDLTTVPEPRSMFDETPRDDIDERLNSLSVYRDRITRPVILDGSHPVDYAPTQVITDAFRYWPEQPLDGIMYPSRVRDGGKNIVLFYGDRMWFESPEEKSSRLEGFIRLTDHNRKTSLFRIDPKTVRRYRVKRDISVSRAWPWSADET